ncbi:MAG: tetraacyldisaccharide 4'-kinase [Oligoflexia bacterium]|nr:tetraacyldisaccharide 4'-kinase [Oligoflexia bacterium]
MNALLSLILLPISLPVSLLLEQIYRLRRFFYRYHLCHFRATQFPLPLISVGNIALGGSGKTPLIIWLIKYLKGEREFSSIPLLIISRGYKGGMEKKGGIWSPSGPADFVLLPDPALVGDEPAMIARQILPGDVLVLGKNRVANLHQFLRGRCARIYAPRIHAPREYATRWIGLLDDAFQHLKIANDLNIVVIDALLPISKYRIFPRGYLREGLSALKYAQMVIFTRADLLERSELDRQKKFISTYMSPTTPIAEVKYSPQGLYNQFYEQVYGVETLSTMKREKKALRAIAMAATASASSTSFFKMLELLGIELLDKIRFADHYDFSGKIFKRIGSAKSGRQNFSQLIEYARQMDAFVIVTEKDIVKINKLIVDQRILFLGIEINFITGENEFREVLRNSIFNKMRQNEENLSPAPISNSNIAGVVANQ